MTEPTAGGGEIRGLSIRQPWAHAIAHLGKTVENRTWKTTYRGLVAIHAAKRFDRWERQEIPKVARIAGVSERLVVAGAEVRGAVVAVGRLADVCSASVDSSPITCDCGPWAQSWQRHIILADTHPLAEPVPCKGMLGLWRLPEDVEAAVMAQLGEVASRG